MITHDAKNIKCVQKQWLTSINDNITFSVTEKKKNPQKTPRHFEHYMYDCHLCRGAVLCLVMLATQ